MHRRIGLLILACIALVIGSSWIVSAQDEQAAPVEGFFFVSSTGGSLTKGDNDIYQLTLEGVPETLDWVVSRPEYFAGSYETPELVANWTANTDTPLSTTGLLRLKTTTLRFMAGQPTYDPLSGVLTLQMTAVEPFPVDTGGKKKKGSGIPDTFDAATLTFAVDDAFNAGLADGSAILDAEGRVERSEHSDPPSPPRQERKSGG